MKHHQKPLSQNIKSVANYKTFSSWLRWVGFKLEPILGNDLVAPRIVAHIVQWSKMTEKYFNQSL
jgi:hypothetical protein